MKIFVSGKLGQETSIRELMGTLLGLGHEVTFDWTALGHLKPYEDHADEAARAAELEIEGVKSADALIVVSHEEGVGLFVEVGAAIGLGKPVFAVVPDVSRTMFFFHP